MVTLLMLSAGLAYAGPFAWVWADEETRTDEYTPDLDYQYNKLEYDDITVDRVSLGYYKVYIPYDPAVPLLPGGNVQATAYGTSSSYCKVSSWGTNNPIDPDAVLVNIRCFNSSGAATDSKFTMMFNSSNSFEWLEYAEPSSRLAYLWADQKSSLSYTPALSYQFNSEGGTNTISRLATGRYQVTLPGMPQFGGTVLVTAYGSGSERCEVSGWTGWTDTTVTVTCHNTAGTLVDSKFTLSYHSRMALANEPTTEVLVSPMPPVTTFYSSGRNGAYTWTGGPASGGLSSSYSWAAETGEPFPPHASVGTLTRLSAGVYDVLLEDVEAFGYFPSTVLVTAYSGPTFAANHCKVGSWSEIDTDTKVAVRCFNTSGAPTDSYFTLTYQDSGSILIIGF